jgi:flagellar biosynthesis protein FlhG
MAGLTELERDADVLLVDTGAGLGREVISFMHEADLAIVVATPEPTSIADAYALIKCALRSGRDEGGAWKLRTNGGEGPRLVLAMNQATNQAEAVAVHARIADVCERFLRHRPPLLGWVSQDQSVGAAVRRRKPLLLDNPKCQASRDLRALSTAVLAILEPSRAPARQGSGISGWLSKLVLRGG